MASQVTFALMAPTSIEKDFLVGQWSVPLEQDPLSFGFLSQPVLAATDPLAQLGAAAEPLNLPLAEVSASGLDWARIDAAVASLNGQHGSAVFQGSTDLDLADYSTLVDLDQLTGLTVVDEPHLLPSTLLEANPPPLLWDAFNSDQLLVRKGSGDIDLLAGLEALRLGDGDDAIVLLHGQPDQLWIDTGAGVDTATVHASEAPLIDQWRGLEQLRWQAVDGAGVPLAPLSQLGADHRFVLDEDQPFSLALSDLFPLDGQLVSLQLQPLTTGSVDWLAMEQRRPDATLAERLVIETLFRDGGGQLLSPEDIAALQPGSLVQADLVVTDTRADGAGLIGLDLDLQWDPAALNLQKVTLDPSLPLFRNRGDLDLAAGRLSGLGAAALPRSGTGSVLGDGLRDLFASLVFEVGSIGPEGLNLQISPNKLPTSRNLPLDPARVLAVGSDPALIPVIHGLADQGQVGEQRFLAEGLYADGRRWQQQLSLVINNVNDAPEVLPAPPLTALEDQPLQLDLSAFFRDQDLGVGDRLSFRLLDAQPDWLVLDATTGLLTGNPDQAQVGSWLLQVEARDQSGASAVQTISLRIENVNDAPQWSGEELPLILLREQREFSITLPTDLFGDQDSGDSLNYSLDLEGHPDLASWLRIDPFTGLLSGVAPLAGGEPVSLTLSATDRDGLLASTRLQLQVVDQTFNRAPYQVGELPQQRTIREGESLSFDLPSLFRDDDRLIGDRLRFEVQAPDWLSFDPQTGRVSGLADNAAVGTHTVSFRALDLDGAVAASTFQLTVQNVNQAPNRLAPASEGLLLQVGSRFQLDLDTIFSDIDVRHGDALSYSLKARSTSSLGIPDWLSWNSATGELSLSPGTDDRGLLSLQFIAADRSGLTSTYQLDLGITAADGLVEVNQVLQDLRLKPGQSSVVEIADAFLQLRGGQLDYSFELLRPGIDGSLTPVSADQAGWITLLDRGAQSPQRSERITVEPVLRLLETGELISAADLANLRAGTGVQLAISVADLRSASTSPGVIGLDLDLEWQGLTLSPDQPADLRQAISDLFPLFRSADLTGLGQQRLRFSAASLPAMGLGQALGDQPGESFLTLNFRLDDPGRPVRIDLTLKDEKQGGLGLGLADGSTGDGVLNLLDLSSTPLFELRFDPGVEQLGNYAVRLQAQGSDGDAVSQIFRLNVGSDKNVAPALAARPGSLALNDSTVERFALDSLFRDSDGDALRYSLRFSGVDQDQERLLSEAIRVVYSEGRALLECAIPGLTQPIQAALTIAASDGLQSVAQTIQLRLNPLSELVPLYANPHHSSVHGGQLVGLADLFASPSLQFGDDQDSVELDLRSDQLLTLRLSAAFRRLAGLNAEQAAQLESTWLAAMAGNDDADREWRIPISELAKLVSREAAAFDLNWLEILAPVQPNSTVAIELATRSRVESDDEGARYGFSQSPWERALLMTSPEGASDVATPAMERQLADLLKRKGGRLAVDDDLAKLTNLGASHLLAWRSKADFQSAVEGTLEDDRSVVMLRVRSSTDPASQKLYSQAEAAYQVRELTVLSKDDDRFAGLAMDAGLEEGAVMAMPWDPLSFTLLKAADANGFLDADPSRLGTQVVVELDVSGSGLLEGELNAYRKFVAPDTVAAAALQGLVLRDLDGRPITQPGWYDFTQRFDAAGRPVGDGARFVVQSIDGERRISKILLTLTDNGFGDNNLTLGVIDDPGAPVKITAAPITPAPLPAQTPSPSPTPAPEPASTSAVDAVSSAPDAAGTDADAVGGAAGGSRGSGSSGGGGGPRSGRSKAQVPGLRGGADDTVAGSQASAGGGETAPTGGRRNGSDDTSLDGEDGTGRPMRRGQAPLGAGQSDRPDLSSPGSAGSGFRRQRNGEPESDNPLQSLFNQLMGKVGEPSTMVGLMMGMLVMPSGVERGFRSLLESGLGRSIQLQRRNPELEAEWPLCLPQRDGHPIQLQLRLVQGRLSLLSQPLIFDPTDPAGSRSPAMLDLNQGGALWQLLGCASRPGELIAQINQRLDQLLHDPLDEIDIVWTAWLDEIRKQCRDDEDPHVWNSLDMLRRDLVAAQAVDPGLADALMSMQLLDCHVRLGGGLPWLRKSSQ